MAQVSRITFKGRRFQPDEVGLVEEVVARFGRLSRQELANTICELLDWRRPNGGLKTWEARELLEILERRGRVQLAPQSLRGRPPGSKTCVPHPARGNVEPELRGVLRDVEPIGLRLVQSPEDRQLWRQLVGRYHPQGHRVPFGASLRYLVEVARPWPAVVACLQLSSPAWKMAVRDRWIGWTDQARPPSDQPPGGCQPHRQHHHGYGLAHRGCTRSGPLPNRHQGPRQRVRCPSHPTLRIHPEWNYAILPRASP